MHKTHFIYIRINGMPCVNRCGHCYLEGSPGGSLMDRKLIFDMLHSSAEHKRNTGCTIFPQFFQEPTVHPDFLEIIERQFELGLSFDNFWFPTNGYGLARMSDDGWERLAKTGLSWIRLTFHGTEHEHDLFVEREGAYSDLLTTAQKAEEFGIEWFAGIFINRENARNYHSIKKAVEAIGHPATEVGWMIPQWLGRAECDRTRPTMDQISGLPAEKPIWRSEESIVKSILSKGNLYETRAFDRFCGTVFLALDPEGRISFAGGCDGDPFMKLTDRMILGSFHENGGLAFYVDEYLNNPPEPVRLLSRVTWGELAQRYGDPSGQMVFNMRDLVVNRWGSLYLEDVLNS